jgi:phospholipase/carboxylesterase
MPAVVVVASLAGSACGWAAGPQATVHHAASGLDAYHVGTGRAPIVLLHGYGARPEEWLPFADTILPGVERLFVFPRAPATTSPPDGPSGGRAWWPLELASYRRDAGSLPDLAAARPPGLQPATVRIRTLLGELGAQYGVAADRIVLGGYSQGAMVAASVAFTTDAPLGALVLLSPTPVDLPTWTRGMPSRRGLPIFVSHGRYDGVLPFTGTERFVATMRERGLSVTWVPFDGVHEVPAMVVGQLSAFLARAGYGTSEPARAPSEGTLP